MSPLTIIMYHYVRDLKNSKYPSIKGLDLSLFKEQIHYLKKHYHIATMEEVIHSVDHQTELPKKSVLLTFDDAYSDHYENVFPILDVNQIQGSFYTPVKAIREHIVLDVNKIHFILASVEDKFILIKRLSELFEIFEHEYALQDFNHYYNKLAHASRMDSKDVIFIKRLLQVELDEELRNKIVDILFTEYVGMSEEDFSKDLYMNELQLKDMLGSGHHIGNHGYNHYWWNSLNKSEMKSELDLSIDFLQNLGVDMENWTACYPYGAYDNQSIEMLKERGCKLAVTTEVAIAKTDKNVRLLMPRLDTNDIPKNQNEKTNDWYDKG